MHVVYFCHLEPESNSFWLFIIEILPLSLIAVEILRQVNVPQAKDDSD